MILFYLSSVFLTYPVVSSDSYYVSTTNGDDNNTGTIDNPWRTIQKAANSVNAGDTVYVRNGTYYEEVSLLNKHGTNTAWITFRPYNNEEVIVDGRNIPNRWNRSIFKITNSSHIHITGFKVYNSARCGFWINALADWIRIDNNTILNCSSNGIYTETSASYTITNISFHHNIVDYVNNNWSGDGGNTSEGVSFRNVQYFDIGYNQISRCGRECIDVKNGSAYGDIHHNSINTSTWDDDPGYFPAGNIWNHIGIYCDAHNERNHHINISNNYVYGDHGYGIAVGVEKPTGSLDNIRIFNNIVNITWINASGISIVNYTESEVPISNISIFSNTVTTTKDYSLDIQADTLTENIRIENNIFTTYNSTIIRIKNYDPTSIIILKNNLFHNNTGPPHNQWNSTWDVSWGENAIIEDPRLESNFSLQWGSPAIDNGTIVPISYDYRGNTRPYRQEFDIGAFEYSTNTPTVFGTPVPANNSLGKSLNFVWSIPISDPENDHFSWTIQCSNTQFANGTNETNGIKSLPLSNLAYDLTYKVWVNTTDTTDTTLHASLWYTFTTRSAGSGPPPQEPPESPNQHPIADTSAGEPYQGILNTEVFFDGSQSYDPDGTITEWFWIFGDTTNGTGKTITHTYSRQGTYTVTLIVTDNNQLTNSTTTTCMIALPNNQPPTKPTISGPIYGIKNTICAYSVTSYDEDNDLICYSINWGDKNSDENKSVFLSSGTQFSFYHQWNTAGIYIITVVVSDNQSVSQPATMTILIDVKYVGDLGYLINQDDDGEYELLYSNITKKEIQVQKQADGLYLIDSDGDGDWDHSYNPATSALTIYHPSTPGFELMLVPYAIIILILFWRKKQPR